MQLGRDGIQYLPGALSPADLHKLQQALAPVAADRPGTRLGGLPELTALLAPTGAVGRFAAAHLGPRTRAVRALLFNKTQGQNWALGWHQDRTIAVQEPLDTPAFGLWTVKSGIHHVEPPFRLLERMLTLRVHLDPVHVDNAPLLVAPGSHRLGRIPEADIASTVRRLGTYACLAERGDVWLYATPILHASDAAVDPRSRRVLQVDFSRDELPSPLAWLGV